MRLLLLIAISLSAVAQDPPPYLLQIVREEVKPGHMDLRLRAAHDSAQRCLQQTCSNSFFTLRSISGVEELWRVEGYDSVEQLESVWNEMYKSGTFSTSLSVVADRSADHSFQPRSMLARFRESLSVPQGLALTSGRYLSITIVQLQPGATNGFTMIRDAIKPTLRRLGRPQLVYQVTSGMEDDTYIIITPARTMLDLHAFWTSGLTYPADAIAASETRLYTLIPALSYPSQRWIEADPDFWSTRE